MAKLVGPLCSLGASGNIANALTYGKNQYGNWVRELKKAKYARSAAQAVIRDWFKSATDTFSDMADEERFLWNLALTNYEDWGAHLTKYVARSAKCLFLHQTLSTQSFTWNGSPFPPSLEQMRARDYIPNYEQLKADLETLTGLVFCSPCDPYVFKYLGDGVNGLSSWRGNAIAFIEGVLYIPVPEDRDQLVAHELTHAIMSQHGWVYRGKEEMSEQIARECGACVAGGALTPVYTYAGKTLSEWVPDPSC